MCLPDVLAVVVWAEHVELDVDRVARVAVLGHDGVGAHLKAEIGNRALWRESAVKLD